MAVEAGLPGGGQLMDDPLAEDKAGVLSFGSPGVSERTEACVEWKAGASDPPWAEDGEKVVRHTRHNSRKVMILTEPELDAAVLTRNFQVSTQQ